MESKAERIELLERTLAIVARSVWPDDWQTVIKVAAAQAESEMDRSAPYRPIRVETIIAYQYPGESKEIIESDKERGRSE